MSILTPIRMAETCQGTDLICKLDAHIDSNWIERKLQESNIQIWMPTEHKPYTAQSLHVCIGPASQ